MDALTDILNSLRMQSRLYFRTELTSPWGVEVPKEGNVARFHIAIRGQCWLKVEGVEESVYMANGDLVIIPHGASHTLADTQNSEIRGLGEVLDEVQYVGEGPLIYGGSGPGCCLVCGEFSFDNLSAHPLLDNLPPVLHVEGTRSYNTQWLDNAIGFIAHEAAAMHAGANAIIDRLAEIIFIQVIRATLAASEEQIPFLSAFSDSRINQVLSAIHSEPEADWTVEKLGQIAAMSRSAFSNKFTELVKMTPLQYIIFVRIQRASRMLQESNASLSVIAESVGYQSEAAFSQAFTKQFGQRPGEFRKQLKAA